MLKRSKCEQYLRGHGNSSKHMLVSARAGAVGSPSCNSDLSLTWHSDNTANLNALRRPHVAGSLGTRGRKSTKQAFLSNRLRSLVVSYDIRYGVCG